MSRSDKPFKPTAEDSGRNAYRTELDPVDERPLLVWAPFWDDVSEQMAYEDAVAENPRHEGEGVMSYIARISAFVTGQYKRAEMTMPRRMSQKEWERRQNELKRQARA